MHVRLGHHAVLAEATVELTAEVAGEAAVERVLLIPDPRVHEDTSSLQAGG